ncbi:alpha/beta hydrolase [Ciceribacter ferrooxidans]|uniref:Alpha/beta hydrolase n=1 Tax=Ciceribacter ferrooxidans TaxID=2509717 RepID=A0A4Q2T8Z2_9HYPH|nr:alpha/beta hydrolase [Ciceribacter ferrooxidans]RYC15363.1 alpha/beta hydrolase [Ciceribacter ferrooxidans]
MQPPPDGDDTFEATVLQPASPSRCILFAAGRGGNPLRHRGLLQALADEGMLVIAPHFDMLASLAPTAAELSERRRRLSRAAARHCLSGLPVAGLGHSIGTVALLLLAGAEADTLAGERVKAAEGYLFDRLALLAPPTDFFRRPGSLTSVSVPLGVWAGERDMITPPAQAAFLREAIDGVVPVDIRLVEGAGHFTFMNELPPHVVDTHPDRADFLRVLADEVRHFLAA